MPTSAPRVWMVIAIVASALVALVLVAGAAFLWRFSQFPGMCEHGPNGMSWIQPDLFDQVAEGDHGGYRHVERLHPGIEPLQFHREASILGGRAMPLKGVEHVVLFPGATPDPYWIGRHNPSLEFRLSSAGLSATFHLASGAVPEWIQGNASLVHVAFTNFAQNVTDWDASSIAAAAERFVAASNGTSVSHPLEPSGPRLEALFARLHLPDRPPFPTWADLGSEGWTFDFEPLQARYEPHVGSEGPALNVRGGVAHYSGEEMREGQDLKFRDRALRNLRSWGFEVPDAQFTIHHSSNAGLC